MTKCKSRPLPLEQMRELLELSATSPTGLRWKISGSGRTGDGLIAGGLAKFPAHPNRNRYFVHFQGVTYRAHRIIYAMHHGVDPGDMQIDHINGVGTDNRIENLRLATSQENNRNRRIAKNNTSGIRGVCWDRFKKKWKAYIMIHGRLYNLGDFDSLDSAKKTRESAELNAFGVFSPLARKGGE